MRKKEKGRSLVPWQSIEVTTSQAERQNLLSVSTAQVLSQFLKIKKVHPGVFAHGIRYIALGDFA